MAILVTGVAVWAVTGVIVAAILARHGHNFWLFALMGLGFGPFLLLIWLEGARGQVTKAVLHRVATSSTPDGGWIDVLVGLDGTSASVASTQRVLATMGPCIGRIRLTSALDHEVSNSPDSFLTDEKRIEYLETAATTLGFDHAEISLVSGRPDKALLDHGRENNFDLLIVAHRSHPVVSGLRGSTVGRLARSAEMPVLIGPPA